MIAAVLSLGTMTAFAQEETTIDETATEATEMTDEGMNQATDATQEATEEVGEATEDATYSAEESTEAASGQGDFSEVTADELPESVTDAVSKNYPTASIDKAYVNESNQYKLEVSLEDGTAGTLYADENGNWIEM